MHLRNERSTIRECARQHRTWSSSTSIPSGGSRCLLRSSEGHRVRAVRPEARDVQQRRAGAGPALLQPGEPERVCARQHASGAAVLAYMRTLERLGARVLNGADVFALELSRRAQATLLRTLGIETPWSITFNDAAAVSNDNSVRVESTEVPGILR